MALGIDAMRSMATKFDDAGHALRAADDIRREAKSMSEAYVQAASRMQGKDFDQVLQFGDDLDAVSLEGREATRAALDGAAAVLRAFDDSGLPVHFRTRVEVGGARELLTKASGWGDYLEPIGDQFIQVGRAITKDITTRMA